MNSLRIAVIVLLLVSSGLSLAPVSQAQGWDPREAPKQKSNLLRKSAEARRAFLESDDSLTIFFEKAYGYVVFPGITKAGVGIGGARGKGVLYRGGKAVKKVYTTQYTVGAQFGGKKYRQIVFFRDAEIYNQFLNDEFEFSAQATATIASDGAGETAAYDSGVAVFILDKAGAMVEASLGGQKFKIKPLR